MTDLIKKFAKILVIMMIVRPAFSVEASSSTKPPYGLVIKTGRAFYNSSVIPMHVYTEIANCSELQKNLRLRLPKNFRIDLYDNSPIQTLIVLPPLDSEKLDSKKVLEEARRVADNLYGFTCMSTPSGEKIVIGSYLGKILSEVSNPQPFRDPLLSGTPFNHQTIMNVGYEFGGYHITHVQVIAETSVPNLREYVLRRSRDLGYDEKQIVMQENLSQSTENNSENIFTDQSLSASNKTVQKNRVNVLGKTIYFDTQLIDEKHSLLTMQIMNQPIAKKSNDWRVDP